MAHFAQLDDQNIVVNVIVVNNDVFTTEEGGVAFCKTLFGSNTRWVQTSYNNNFRGVFASVGSIYDITNDVFVNKEMPALF